MLVWSNKNHFTVCKQMRSGSFKNDINKLYVYKSYISNLYIYKPDVRLNNPQGLICHKPT